MSDAQSNRQAMLDTSASEPGWLTLARSHIGLREIPGPAHQPVISAWLHRLGAWWNDDEVPWCGTFVAAMMQQTGQPLPAGWFRARAWLDWGVDVQRPYLGSVVVLSRGPGKGHVGLVVGWRGSQLAVLGGNQGDAVSIAGFAPDRILGYRWPANAPAPTALATQLVAAVAASRSEA